MDKRIIDDGVWASKAFLFFLRLLLCFHLLEANLISNGRVFVVCVLYLVFGRYHIYTLRHRTSCLIYYAGHIVGSVSHT